MLRFVLIKRKLTCCLPLLLSFPAQRWVNYEGLLAACLVGKLVDGPPEPKVSLACVFLLSSFSVFLFV